MRHSSNQDTLISPKYKFEGGPCGSVYMMRVYCGIMFAFAHACSRVVKRSKAYVWHARMKKKQDRSKQFCLFYSRFGNTILLIMRVPRVMV